MFFLPFRERREITSCISPSGKPKKSDLIIMIPEKHLIQCDFCCGKIAYSLQARHSRTSNLFSHCEDKYAEVWYDCIGNQTTLNAVKWQHAVIPVIVFSTSEIRSIHLYELTNT